MTCTLAGIAASPGRGLSTWQIGTLSLAVLLASGTAGVFNQLYERQLDARMARTRNRPFVTGRFQAGGHWLGALALTLLLALTAAALATNLLAAIFVFLGAFIYGVIYTVWLKRRTWWNIVIGGLAGSFAVLAGAAATDSLLAPAPLLLAIVLFLWTPPHFWALAYAHKRDYQAAGIPMLPVLVEDRVCTRVILAHVIALVLLSLAPAFYGMGWLYVTGAVIGGVHFLWTSWRLEQAPSIQQVNTARGKICERDAVVRALESGQLAGYAGDVWFPQPAPKDHPWRTMPNHGMTPHISGSSLSAQARYAAGVREILECWFQNRPIREEYLIVEGGKLAGAGAHSYSAGDATAGSDEASRSKI